MKIPKSRTVIKLQQSRMALNVTLSLMTVVKKGPPVGATRAPPKQSLCLRRNSSRWKSVINTISERLVRGAKTKIKPANSLRFRAASEL